MNVLYVERRVSGLYAHLVTPAADASGELPGLRALAGKLRARGATILVTPADIHSADVPGGLKEAQLFEFLDGKHKGVTSAAPDRPLNLVGVHDQQLVNQARGVARAAGLKVVGLTTLASCVQRLRPDHPSSVTVYPGETDIELTSVSPVEALSRRQVRNEKSDVSRIVLNAVTRLSQSGNEPIVFYVQTPGAPDVRNVGVKVATLTLPEALRGATLSAPSTEGQHGMVARMARSLNTERRVDRPLLAVLALAASVNGGVYLYTQSVLRDVRTLEVRRDELTRTAAIVDALKKQNDELATRNGQVRTLLEAKGPLAQDLPLLVSRVTERPGRLVSLAGPNATGAEDARAFGGPVARSYEVNAVTSDPEEFIANYQDRGVRADIRSVDCTAGPCTVVMRIAPTPEAATPTTPAATPSTETRP